MLFQTEVLESQIIANLMPCPKATAHVLHIMPYTVPVARKFIIPLFFSLLMNTRKTMLPLKHKQREGSAGMKIRIAERDQKILESQEYIQVSSLYMDSRKPFSDHFTKIR